MLEEEEWADVAGVPRRTQASRSSTPQCSTAVQTEEGMDASAAEKTGAAVVSEEDVAEAAQAASGVIHSIALLAGALELAGVPAAALCEDAGWADVPVSTSSLSDVSSEQGVFVVPGKDTRTSGSLPAPSSNRSSEWVVGWRRNSHSERFVTQRPSSHQQRRQQQRPPLHNLTQRLGRVSEVATAMRNLLRDAFLQGSLPRTAEASKDSATARTTNPSASPLASLSSSSVSAAEVEVSVQLTSQPAMFASPTKPPVPRALGPALCSPPPGLDANSPSSHNHTRDAAQEERLGSPVPLPGDGASTVSAPNTLLPAYFVPTVMAPMKGVPDNTGSAMSKYLERVGAELVSIKRALSEKEK